MGEWCRLMGGWEWGGPNERLVLPDIYLLLGLFKALTVIPLIVMRYVWVLTECECALPYEWAWGWLCVFWAGSGGGWPQQSALGWKRPLAAIFGAWNEAELNGDVLFWRAEALRGWPHGAQPSWRGGEARWSTSGTFRPEDLPSLPQEAVCWLMLRTPTLRTYGLSSWLRFSGENHTWQTNFLSWLRRSITCHPGLHVISRQP